MLLIDFATWSAGGQLLLGVPPHQPGGQEVGHVSLMEAGLWAVDELPLQLGLPLHVCAAGRACSKKDKRCKKSSSAMKCVPSRPHQRAAGN